MRTVEDLMRTWSYHLVFNESSQRWAIVVERESAVYNFAEGRDFFELLSEARSQVVLMNDLLVHRGAGRVRHNRNNESER